MELEPGLHRRPSRSKTRWRATQRRPRGWRQRGSAWRPSRLQSRTVKEGRESTSSSQAWRRRCCSDPDWSARTWSSRPRYHRSIHRSANAISRSEPSTLTVLVTNAGSQIVREVDILLPSQYGAVTSSSGPADGTWAATRAGGVAYFRANCSGPGIPPSDSASFVIGFDCARSTPSTATTPPAAPSRSRAPPPPGRTSAIRRPPPTPRRSPPRSRRSTSPASWPAPTPRAATVTWTVSNNNGSADGERRRDHRRRLARHRLDVGTCTTDLFTSATADPNGLVRVHLHRPRHLHLHRHRTRRGRDGNSTAAGTIAGTFTYGTVPIVTWSKIHGGEGPRHQRAQPQRRGRVERQRHPRSTCTTTRLGWTSRPAGCAPGGSATNGLTYPAPPTSTTADLVLTGSLGAGVPRDIVVTYTGVPNVSTRHHLPVSREGYVRRRTDDGVAVGMAGRPTPRRLAVHDSQRLERQAADVDQHVG